jgi:hypothetical protein
VAVVVCWGGDTCVRLTSGDLWLSALVFHPPQCSSSTYAMLRREEKGESTQSSRQNDPMR